MGLYDNDNAAVSGGDVLDVTYWQTKFNALKLDAALATRQPEYPIRLLTAGVVNGCEDALRTYPNHADLKAWRDKAAAIQNKIDPNAAPDDFNSRFLHWRDYAYEAGWRSYHIARMAAAQSEWRQAHGHASEAVTQLGRAEERMAAWPEDVQEWVRAARLQMESLREDAVARR